MVDVLTQEKRDWPERFFKRLKDCGNVSDACRFADISREAVYEHRRGDPEFARRWEEALETAADSLEKEAFRRARDGTLKPVYQGGDHVGDVREYSDTLMIFLLKGNRREKYGDRSDLNINVRDLDTTIERGLAKLAGSGEGEAARTDSGEGEGA